jgi:DNA polymerase type B, organellar and viral
MRGYDGCFLLRYLAENGCKPSIILRDKKILALFISVLQIRIIDSLNFLPMALSQFSKAFNIPTTKGYFPHFFSRPEIFDYIGKIPDEKMYGIGNMKPSQYKEFKIWYEQQKNSQTVFNFREQIAFYCRQDVLLLQQGCWVFRELMLGLTDKECDAFQYLTLPGLCNAVYKKMFMPPNSIAAVPPNGYAATQSFSTKSLEWLSYLELTIPSIKHIGNSITGEVEIANMRVDGFHKEKKTVYEFNGCYYHGCPKCYPDRNDLHTLFKQTLHHVYTLTKEREKRLRLLGYKVVTIWECEWKKRVESELEIQRFLENNPHKLQPLDPFKAFFGGRVETFNLLIQNDGRNIKYEDVNSLYPFINATKVYPIGHPIIICNNFGCPNTVTTRYFGFVYCKVKTPKKLYIPVLPGKYGGDSKLIFTLCRSCASAIPRHTNYCQHSDEERALTGVWFTEELKVAESKGYEIVEVYSVYHFQEKSDKLFADYIRTFYKIKNTRIRYPKD